MEKMLSINWPEDWDQEIDIDDKEENNERIPKELDDEVETFPLVGPFGTE